MYLYVLFPHLYCNIYYITSSDSVGPGDNCLGKCGYQMFNKIFPGKAKCVSTVCLDADKNQALGNLIISSQPP